MHWFSKESLFNKFSYSSRTRWSIIVPFSKPLMSTEKDHRNNTSLFCLITACHRQELICILNKHLFWLRNNCYIFRWMWAMQRAARSLQTCITAKGETTHKSIQFYSNMFHWQFEIFSNICLFVFISFTVMHTLVIFFLPPTINLISQPSSRSFFLSPHSQFKKNERGSEEKGRGRRTKTRC